ncbi:MAG: hypothetical protein EZS28_045194, partial [Streblomastix strix]
SPFKAYPQQASRGKSYRLDYPEQEKGTLSGQMTEYVSNIEPVTVDFSNIRSDSPQLRGVNWGALGPPATVGLGEMGAKKPSQELLLLQQRQEEMLSRQSSQYNPNASQLFQSETKRKY